MTSVSCRVWPSWQHKCDPCGPRGTLSLTCLFYETKPGPRPDRTISAIRPISIAFFGGCNTLLHVVGILFPHITEPYRPVLVWHGFMYRIASTVNIYLLYSECRQVWSQNRSGRGNKNRNNCLSVTRNHRRQVLTLTAVLTFPDWEALNRLSLY